MFIFGLIGILKGVCLSEENLECVMLVIVE